MTDAALGLGINWLGWDLYVISMGLWEDMFKEGQESPSAAKLG